MKSNIFGGQRDFDIYLLMTMRPWLSRLGRESRIESKLSKHGLSFTDAESLYQQIGDVLADESTRFENMRKIIDSAGQSATSLAYRSILWPDFEFRAGVDAAGLLTTARYWHLARTLPHVQAPDELPMWSVDLTEFADMFGPSTNTLEMPFFHPLLPAYTEFAFSFRGKHYGAGFMWGLLLQSSQYWPEG